jgi:hypothetical protein
MIIIVKKLINHKKIRQINFYFVYFNQSNNENKKISLEFFKYEFHHK